jgi:hypothetical protein
MTRGLGLGVGLVCLGVSWSLASPALAASPSPAPPPAATTPTATPTPVARLHLDVDEVVREHLEHDQLPRFEIEVLGHTPQAMFEMHLRGFNKECGATGGGAPTTTDMRGIRPQSPPVIGVDLVKLLGEFKKLGPDRYFLYRATSPGGVSYLVREGRMPPAQLVQNGVVLEVVGAFHDAATATRAWRRLERGYRTAVAEAPRSIYAPCIQ